MASQYIAYRRHYVDDEASRFPPGVDSGGATPLSNPNKTTVQTGGCCGDAIIVLIDETNAIK